MYYDLLIVKQLMHATTLNSYYFHIIHIRYLMCEDQSKLSAIVYHDQRMAPPSMMRISVLTSDVVFGITNESSGFTKWSFNTLLTPDHDAFVLTIMALTREDFRTFEWELQFLKDTFSDLLDGVFVVIVDGDLAKINAFKAIFPDAIIILCLYHSSENFKKRFGRYRGGLNISSAPKEEKQSSINISTQQPETKSVETVLY